MKLSSRERKKIAYHHHDVKAGSVIMRAGTVTPERLEIESEDFCEGWNRVRNCDAGLLDRQLRGAGWHLFFLAEAVQAVAVGGFDQDTVQHATARLIQRSGPQMFNCFEVTQIDYRHLLGVPYVHVIGHARHVQRDLQIGSFASRKNEIDRTTVASTLSGMEELHSWRERDLDREIGPGHRQ